VGDAGPSPGAVVLVVERKAGGMLGRMAERKAGGMLGRMAEGLIGCMAEGLLGRKGLAVGNERSSMRVEGSRSGWGGLEVRVYALLPKLGLHRR